MPIRRRPPNRSMLFSVSFHTLATIAPTVRQAIRINSHTAVFEHATASQATVSSKAKVCPAWWRAHGTATTVGPWVGQFTRGASASSTTCTVPQSRPRQRRRPSPRSYQGALQPQRPQRRETPLRGRTRATTSVSPSASSSSNSSTSMPSITVRWSTPSSARHNLTSRTSLPAPLVPDLRQARNLKRQRRAPSHINNAPTEVSEEPYSRAITSWVCGPRPGRTDEGEPGYEDRRDVLVRHDPNRQVLVHWRWPTR